MTTRTGNARLSSRRFERISTTARAPVGRSGPDVDNALELDDTYIPRTTFVEAREIQGVFDLVMVDALFRGCVASIDGEFRATRYSRVAKIMFRPQNRSSGNPRSVDDPPIRG
jgi:hypothetical protein